MLRLSKSEDEFQELYRAHYGSVRRTLNAMTGIASVAEELTQEAFLKSWRALPQFGFRSSMKTWVFQVAINLGRDWLRSHKNKPILQDEEITPELTVEQRAVQEALLELEEDTRTLLILFYYEGMDLSELSKVLSVPTGTVKSRLHAAKGKLRPILLSKGFDV